jgi:hypothetical protein
MQLEAGMKGTQDHIVYHTFEGVWLQVHHSGHCKIWVFWGDVGLGGYEHARR